MKKTLVALVALAHWACAQPSERPAPASDAAHAVAERVTIVRDDWGIPHVSGRTDADAVFGVMYAQAEDDFNRVETNLINALGRLAEAEGESAIFRDLRMKLFVDPDELKQHYAASPDSLKALMDAWAAGLNFYLQAHPQVKPRVISRFEPWMALSFTEGSIGGDIEQISIPQLEAFYGTGPKVPQTAALDIYPPEPTGSNGFAIAPANSASHHALLWINPHTSFFFRAEAQVTSEEGLNAYGALTWGQFFIYQGFNSKAGWMHTSSGVDNIDEYLETIDRSGEALTYRYGTERRPVAVSTIRIPYKTPGGAATREFTVYRTHHGPVVRQEGDQWVSVRLMQEPVKSLTQSYMRTKALNYRAFRDVMELHTNSSNNTVFADAEGNIAYLHANFIPRRDTVFDWNRPVDGSNPATEWKGVLSIDESPNVLNPPNGWIQNTNNWPFSAAGCCNSPKRADFPPYVERGVENPRGVHAVRVLEGKKGFTPESLIAAAFDPALPEFDILMPTLLKAFDTIRPGDPLRRKLSEPLEQLRTWDRRWAADSVPTTLAVFWGEALWERVAAEARTAGVSAYTFMETRASPDQRLQALAAVVDKLTADFGTWKLPWGDVNRFQRVTGDIVQPFDDAKPSIPVAFTSARWGSLASFGARSYNGSKKIYGTTGNSFLAVVEFGDRVRARAITAGGQSGDPSSPHFNDQAVRYSSGDLREVYFYPDQLQNHTERTYHPGE
jgi:acyl-homoserine-lactone acylase